MLRFLIWTLLCPPCLIFFRACDKFVKLSNALIINFRISKNLTIHSPSGILYSVIHLVWSQWDTVIFLISMSHHLSSNFDINVPNLSHPLNPGFPTYRMKGHSCSCILLFPLKDNNTDSIKFPST